MSTSQNSTLNPGATKPKYVVFEKPGVELSTFRTDMGKIKLRPYYIARKYSSNDEEVSLSYTFLCWFFLISIVTSSAYALWWNFLLTSTESAELDLTLLSSVNFAVQSSQESLPNFVTIILDDLGWGDIKWHNADFATPNIDKLFGEGLEFTNHHSGVICTCARASILTGRYPWRLGLQNLYDIFDYLTPGIPTQETMHSELLREHGYKNFWSGKWNVGWYNWDYWPMNRGFDSWLGYHTGSVDYFNHTFVDGVFDFWIDDDIFWNSVGNWTDDIFLEHGLKFMSETTDPFSITFAFEAPHAPYLLIPDSFQDDLNCRHLRQSSVDDGRYVTCMRVTHTDDLIGQIVSYLKDSGLWDNTLLMFLSDNGGNTWDVNANKVYSGFSSNYPYRGGKGSFFEGGIRVPFAISGGLLPSHLRQSQDERLSHHVDFLPTMLTLAGFQDDIPANTDGLDLLSITKRQTLVHSLKPTTGFNPDKCPVDDSTRSLVCSWTFPVENQTNAVTYLERWKYIRGYQYVDGWFNVDTGYKEYGFLPDEQPCFPSPCLFDLQNDQYERKNVATENPDIVEAIVRIIKDAMEGDDYHSGQDYDQHYIDYDSMENPVLTPNL